MISQGSLLFLDLVMRLLAQQIKSVSKFLSKTVIIYAENYLGFLFPCFSVG